MEIVACVEVLVSHWVGEQVSERSFIGVLGTQMEKQLKEMLLGTCVRVVSIRLQYTVLCSLNPPKLHTMDRSGVFDP